MWKFDFVYDARKIQKESLDELRLIGSKYYINNKLSTLQINQFISIQQTQNLLLLAKYLSSLVNYRKISAFKGF